MLSSQRVKCMHWVLVVSWLLCGFVAGAKGPVVSLPQPDLILYNGTVLTINKHNHVAQAMALHGDRIVAVGQNADVLALQGPLTRMHDLAGQTIMPGFVDPHSHLFNDFWALNPNLETAQKLLIKYGVTTLGNLFASSEVLSNLRAFEPSLKVRTSLYLSKTHNCGDIDSDWYLDHPPTRNFGERAAHWWGENDG